MRRESRSIDRATRRAVAGARLATIAVGAGALATVASLLAVAYVASTGAPSTTSGHNTVLASHAERAPVEAAGARRLDGVSHDRRVAVHEERIGDILLVDVGTEVSSLDEEFLRQVALAGTAHERLLVWLVTEDCKRCNAVESALPTAELQRALGRARLVRVDALEFLAELSRLGAPLDAFPAFVLLGPEGHARDYIQDEEWGDPSPENIAPVLKSFVEGTLSRRRSPWRGGLHEDETPI